MRILDLFSGIGGFSLGLHMAGGFETVQFVEIDPYCQRVLAKNFPGVPIHDDIRTYRPAPGSADLVCGGFPCQPFSHAGKRQGAADDRDLWPQMAHVIAAVRPAWVVGENVAGFIQMELDRSISDLESLGYAVQAFCIPACAVNAPHRRDRVWIVAYREGNRLEKQWLSAEGREVVADTQRRSRVCDHSGEKVVADRERERLQGQCKTGAAPRATDRSGYGRDSCQWLPEPGMGRVAHGIPRRMDRLRGLGNAVVPQVVCEIGKAIMIAEAAAREEK